MKRSDTSEFYADLPRLGSFSELTNSDVYSDLPNDWTVGMTDVVGSTAAIANGKYKTVNMVGAAVISAQINTMGKLAFPFVFGGDGATFAIPPQQQAAAAQQMSAVRQWAKDEFGLELRATMIPVSEIKKAGHSITVARFAASSGVDYAMFRGSGISWAEIQMKSDGFIVPSNDTNMLPNLTGLSCRWTSMKAQNGSVISLVIVPTDQSNSREFDRFARALIELVSASERGSRPIPDEGPGASWPPEGLALEAHASHGKSPLILTKIKLLAETLLAWVFIKTKMKAGDFDPVHYQKTVGQNADFRKFEEGLKMTLDCSPSVKKEIVELLDESQKDGVIRYGMHEQTKCMMTCIVPSIMTDDHVHFIDGAEGGYTTAAERLKAGNQKR